MQMTLPNELRHYRKLNKYSQERLAELLGVSRQAVTKWENGKSAPSTENLIKLAAIYKISLDDLINDRPELSNVELKPKRKSKLKLIIGICAIGLIMLIIVIKVSEKRMVVFTIVYILILAILIAIISTIIYFVILLAKALKKYLHS